MSKLPSAWETVALGDIAEKIGSGATPAGGRRSYAVHGTPLIRSMNIHFNGFKDEGLVFLNDEQARQLDGVIVRQDDVLLNITGASIGRVTLAPERMDGARVNQHVSIIRLVDGVPQKFVASYLSSPKMQQFILDENYGVTRQALTKSMIENFQLPFPPILEQRRIVAKIDSLAAKSARTRDHLSHIPRLVEKYKQAILAAAFRGELTREWRNREHRWDAWGETTLGKLLKDIRYGTAKKCDYGGGPTKVLRIPNVQMGSITLDDLKSATFDKNELSRLSLQQGDILVIRSNGSLGLVGRCAVVDERAVGMLFAGYLIRLRLDQNAVFPSFVRLWFEADGTRSVIERLAKSTSGVNNINSAQLEQLLIPLPVVEEQYEIVRHIETAFGWIDRLASEAGSAARLIDRLDQAVLAKAFRGELVQQDPADEPAAKLLERIRAERAAAEPPRRTRKKVRA